MECAANNMGELSQKWELQIPCFEASFRGGSALRVSLTFGMRLNSLNRDMFKPFRSHSGLLG